MEKKAVLVAGADQNRRISLMEKLADELCNDDTVRVNVGNYEKRDYAFSYEKGMRWLLSEFRNSDDRKLLIIINDIVPMIDTPEGYLLTLIIKLYMMKGADFIIGTGSVSAEYITSDLLYICSPVISFRLYSEMQSRILFGRKGAENLADDEYMIKKKRRVRKGIL